MCDPDYNVWTKTINEAPESNDKLLLRTAGGHIHVGYKDSNVETSLEIIKAMDLFLGVPSIILDTDTERRKMYGKAGCFRIKQYGFEYRTLSNFWIASEELVNWAFEQTLNAINFVNQGNIIDEELGLKIVDCINNQNKELANKIIKTQNIICVV